VIGVVGGTASAASRTLGHWISFAITTAMMIIVCGYTGKKIEFREGNFLSRYGPFIMVSIATPLILADIVRHLMSDTNFWPWCGNNDSYPRINQTWNDGCLWSSTEYKCDQYCCVPGKWTGNCGENGEGCNLNPIPVDAASCACDCTSNEIMSQLSPIGIIFTIVFTYLGFIFLSIGVLWNANILDKLKKIKHQWRLLRDPEYRRQCQEEAMSETAYVKYVISRHNVVVFSKTTCPFCLKAKQALNEEGAVYEVIELDKKDNMIAIQDALQMVSNRRTVPNVFIKGVSIGGGDDTVAKHNSGELRQLLIDAGALKKSNTSINS
jgi:glutaredoxin 3